VPHPARRTPSALGRPAAHATILAASVALAAAVAGPLAACSAPANDAPRERTPNRDAAPLTRGDADQGVVTESGSLRIVHGDWSAVGYRWDWSAAPRLERGGEIIHIDPAGDVIIVQDRRGTVVAMETSSGRTRWAAEVSDSLTRLLGAARVNDAVLAFSGPATHVLDVNTGNFRTRQDLDTVVGTRALIVDGLTVFGTPVGRIHAHEFGTPGGQLRAAPLDVGGQAWAYQLEGAVNHPPVLVEGRVAVATASGVVFFIDPLTAGGVGRGRMYGGPGADPVTDGRRLFVASLDQSVYAFDADGSLAWRYPSPDRLTDAPTVHSPSGDPAETVLYVNIPSEGMTAFDGPTGEVLWQNPGVDGTMVTARDGDPVVVSGDVVTLLDNRDGSVIERFAVDGLERVIADAPSDGILYALGADGHIARFTPRR